MANSHETFQDRLRKEWIRSEKVVDTLIAQVEERQKQTRTRTKQARAETEVLFSRLDRFDDSGGAPA